MQTSSPNKTNEDRSLKRVETADEAFQHLKHLATNETEELWALALGPRKRLLKAKMIFRGTVDSCLVHPRDIFRFACIQNASSIVIAHNHPSGELLPSYEDIRFTQQLIHASRFMEIPIVDHLIISTAGYTSLRTECWANFTGEDEFSTRTLNDET